MSTFYLITDGSRGQLEILAALQSLPSSMTVALVPKGQETGFLGPRKFFGVKKLIVYDPEIFADQKAFTAVLQKLSGAIIFLSRGEGVEFLKIKPISRGLAVSRLTLGPRGAMKASFLGMVP